MNASTILVIDSDADRRRELRTILEFMEQGPVIVSDAGTLDGAIAGEDLLAVLVGDCGDAGAQARLLQAIQARDPEVPLLRIGTFPDPAAGFFGTIDLPLRYSQLSHILHQAGVRRELQQHSGGRRPVELFRSLVGNSRAVTHVRRMIEQVAESDATVLILGESGTGKEVAARNLHFRSMRRQRAFVPINCGAIPAELLESELFGHEKGAFTGAVSARQGRFELAEGGTLFLDEIGDMSLPMQVKLLRVLQERTFERVGSNRSIKADVRIIAATHRDLEQAIREGRFREDLYYRLNVFPIDMPPLRERAEDVPLLVAEIVARIEHERGGSVRFTPAALLCLGQYGWPGNVRELANLVERMAILYPNGLVDVEHLPEKMRSGHRPGSVVPTEAELPQDPQTVAPRLPFEGLDLKEHLNRIEYTLIKRALEESDGVVAQAAKRLHLGRTTLVEKMRKFQITAAEN